MTILLAVISLIGPVLAGWLLVQRIWPDVPLGLRLSLSASLGFGIVGTVYFLGLLLFDSSSWAFAISECMLGGAIAALVIKGRQGKTREDKKARFNPTALIFVLCALIAGAALFFALDSVRHGGWDAFVMWNLRARFISTSQTSPFSALLDPVFLGLHPDYPLLLPALVSRGWQYTGGSLPVIPMAIAALFTIATIFITVASLQVISTRSQSWIAGCVLLTTPFLIDLAASQYADIVICCFMTTAVVLYAIYDSDSTYSRLPLLAGIAAAAAACTKNEGILFLAVLVASRALAVWRGRSPLGGGELVIFGCGAAFGVLTLSVFKLAHSAPNDTLQLTTVRAMLATMTSASRNLDLIKGIRDSLNFGQWRLNPIPLMALHSAVVWKPSQLSTKVRPWFTPAFVTIGMLCGHYAVYLLSPYDVEAHVRSSLDRLLMQLWPIAIVLYSVVAAPRDSGQTHPASFRSVALRAAAVVAVIAAIMVWSSGQKSPARIAAGSRPHIEVNGTEVTVGDTYRLKIAGVSGPQVYVSYSIDGKPMGQFGAYLGTDGAVDFRVSPSTQKGTYRFLAVRTADSPAWIPPDNDVALVVK